MPIENRIDFDANAPIPEEWGVKVTADRWRQYPDSDTAMRLLCSRRHGHIIGIALLWLLTIGQPCCDLCPECPHLHVSQKGSNSS